MGKTAITIDFWQTLYDNEGGPERTMQRRDVVVNVLRREGYDVDPDEVDRAHKNLWEFFDRHWLGSQRTPTSREMIGEMMRMLDADPAKSAIDEIVTVYEEGILDHSPSLLPGVREALEYLASQAPLALISDTAFSPGSVLKRLMEQDRIAEYFRHFVFSDETGVAKPHPRAFESALAELDASASLSLHIGDIERTDVAGAKSAGMKAVLYKSPHHQHKYAEDATEADIVLDHWNRIEDALSGHLHKPVE